MFAAQIGPSTPLPGDPTKQPVPPQLAGPNLQPGQPVPAEPDQPTPEQEEAELKAWERLAVKHLGQGGYTFTPRVLPLFQAARIRAGLKSAQTADAVRGVFARERGQDDLMAQAVTELRRYNDIAGPS